MRARELQSPVYIPTAPCGGVAGCTTPRVVSFNDGNSENMTLWMFIIVEDPSQVAGIVLNYCQWEMMSALHIRGVKVIFPMPERILLPNFRWAASL